MNRSTSTRSLRFSTERRLALAALLAAGLLLPGAMPGGAAAPEDVRAKVREALADPRYQRALPQHEEEPEVEVDRGSRRRRPAGPAESGSMGPDVSLPAIGAGAFLGRVVLVVLLVVVVLLIGGWIGRALLDRRRKGGAEAPATGGSSGASSPAPILSFDDASRLAAEGRHAEAVHALLLAAIRHFAERARVSIQPSRTSRELVRILPLGPEAREAFADLVGTVERSLFGGSAVQAEDYERSLARFQALTRRTAA
jgi:hypothetical protein